MNSTLKPCPFCGRSEYAAISHYEADPGYGYIVYCSAEGWGDYRGCGASGGWAETPDTAAEAWNRRAKIDEVA